MIDDDDDDDDDEDEDEEAEEDDDDDDDDDDDSGKCAFTQKSMKFPKQLNIDVYIGFICT